MQRSRHVNTALLPPRDRPQRRATRRILAALAWSASLAVAAGCGKATKRKDASPARPTVTSLEPGRPTITSMADDPWASPAVARADPSTPPATPPDAGPTATATITPTPTTPPPRATIAIEEDHLTIDPGTMTINSYWSLVNTGDVPVGTGTCIIHVADGRGCDVSDPASVIVRAFTRSPPGTGKETVIPIEQHQRLSAERIVVPGGEALLWVKIPLARTKKCVMDALKARAECPGAKAIHVDEWHAPTTPP